MFRKELEEAYKDEISCTRAILENNPEFATLPYKKQINLAASIIVELKKFKTDNNDKAKCKI